MAPTETREIKALTLAARRWKKAAVLLTADPLPQLAEIAAHRGSGKRPLRAVPSPFRPRRA